MRRETHFFFKPSTRWILAGATVLLAGAVGLAAQEPVPSQPAGRPRAIILSLDDALRIAAGESETVWVAQAGVMRAVGNERIARSGFFPQVTGSASYTRTLRSQFDNIRFGDTGGGGEEPVDLPFGRENQYSLALSLSQLVFDAGQRLPQVRFQEGISTQIELSDSRLQLEQAQVNRALALRDVQVARARLALLEDLPLGTGTGATTQPIQIPATQQPSIQLSQPAQPIASAGSPLP